MLVVSERAPSARQALARLVWPIYAPMLLAAIGSTALMPMIPLIALELGFSVPAAAALTMISGLVGVLGPIPAGRAMTMVGERTAMIVMGVGLALSGLAGFAVVSDGLGGGDDWWHRVAFVLVLFASAVCQQVWMLGRQSYMGSQLPVAVRARGMSTLGGMMRIGQVIGPVLGAGVLVVAHEGYVFLLQAVTALAATLLVTFKMLPPEGDGPAASRASRREASRTPIPPTPAPHAPGRPAIATMLLTGLGIVPLNMARINRPLILPLLGAVLGLDAATISLVFGAAALVEIVMFVPAGTLMDRRGRAAVAVPALLVSGLSYVLLAVLAVTIGTRSEAGALVAVTVSAVFVALGNGLSAGIVMTLGVDLSPEEHRTRHLARWNTITSVGRFAGPGLVAGVTLFAPVAAAGLATGVLCVAGGLWLWKYLPGVTPSPNGPPPKSS